MYRCRAVVPLFDLAFLVLLCSCPFVSIPFCQIKPGIRGHGNIRPWRLDSRFLGPTRVLFFVHFGCFLLWNKRSKEHVIDGAKK